MRKIQRLSLAAIALATIVAGCSDTPAPTAAVAVDAQPQLSLVDGSTYTGKFVVSASTSTTFTDGVNTLYFPAGAVCDPAVSSYGPGEWDKPCTTITNDLTITVTAVVSRGRVNLDFSPSLRFNPGKSVTLTVRNDAIRNAKDIREWAVFFNAGDGTLVDEAKADRSVITHVDVKNGAVIRRIKHFTGYNVTSGMIDDCTPYVDPWCRPIGDADALE